VADNADWTTPYIIHVEGKRQMDIKVKHNQIMVEDIKRT